MMVSTELDIVSAHVALAAGLSQHEALVQGQRRLTWADFEDRTDRLGRYLEGRGLGCSIERASLAGHESGQDHVGILLHNCLEYVESMVGILRARAAPFNINYRYGNDELVQVLTDAGTQALIYHASFAATVEQAISALSHPVVLIQVADPSGNDLLPEATDYEKALDEAPDIKLEASAPDDLFIIYTGGTTGMPKGVLWRQADLFVSALGGRNFHDGGREWSSLDEMVTASQRGGYRSLPAAPMMHAAAQWMTFQTLHAGGTVVFPERGERFNAEDVVRIIAEESIDVVQIVGDPLAVPLTEAIRKYNAPLPLKVVASGGTLFRQETKSELTSLVPGLKIRDTMGSSEGGPQAQTTSIQQGGALSTFKAGPETCVIDEMRSRLTQRNEIGWLATAGRIPLGYLGDIAKTASTFPVVGGRRMSVPGDRARVLADGTIEVLGRDATTINTGGEKVYAQEVEAVLVNHPSVEDVLVVGRPSKKWGHEVVAVVTLAVDQSLSLPELGTFCDEHLASYKKPRALVIVESIRRNEAGKPNYRWATEIVSVKDV
jgi:acyl-CoA synthetase (AMP-forming)/AMP-acid ligase II